jgi:hypothetical protein
LCNASSRGIRIRWDNTWPAVGALGSNLDGVVDGMHLNVQFTFTALDAKGNSYQPFGGCIGNEKVCAENIAVHEFGQGY